MTPEFAEDTFDVWYDCPLKPDSEEHAAHRKLFPHVRQLEEDQRDIHVLNCLNAKMYTNRESMSFEWESDYHTHFRPINTNIENIVQSICDTLEARIGANRPKATILSRGAQFDTYLKARQLDRFLWGEFVFHKIHQKMSRIFLDGLIYGTGVLKMDIDSQTKDIYCERVNPDEIVVDQRECVSCDTPMQIHHRKLVSRLFLLKTWGAKNPELKQKIKEAQPRGFTYTSYRSPADEQLVVIESWKLPSFPDAGDGRHVICIENATLLHEEYTRDRFPFVFYKWAQPQAGFYGRSLVSDIIGYQIRQNDLNETQRMGMDLMTVPRIFADYGAQLSVEQLDDSIAKVIKVRGGEIPTALTWNAFPAEFYQERDRNRESAFRFSGVSELSSQSKLPTQARLDSSDALREFSAIEDSRFNGKTQAYEECFKEVADHFIELNKILRSKYKKTRKSMYRTSSLVEDIDWKEVDMERDKYVLEIGASSILNMSPAARKDTLNDWLMRGIIDIDTYKANSGQPDLEHLADLMTAKNDYIEFHIDKMLKGDDTITPDPLMDLTHGFHVVHDTYQHIRTLDAPEEIIDIFVAWLEIAKEMVSPTPAPAEAMAMQQGIVPQQPMGLQQAPQMMQ
jgi:hypothetical protein